MSLEEALQQLDRARTKYEIAEALASICKEEPIPPDPRILAFVEDPRWLVRHTAIEALGKCPDVAAETALLDRASTTDDHYDLKYINAALGNIGSERCLPHLEQMVSHRKEDVACSAVSALRRLGLTGAAFFVSCLGDRRGAVKSYAMAAIEEIDDPMAVEAVIKRVRYMLSRVRRREQLPRTELVEALTYLWRHREADKRIEPLIDRALGEKRERLFEREVDQLLELVGRQPARDATAQEG